MAKLLYRLAVFCGKNRLVVVGAWAAILVLTLLVIMSGSELNDGDFTIPGTDSDNAGKVLAQEFPSDSTEETDSLQLVFYAPDGSIESDVATAAIASISDTASQLDHVVGVSDNVTVSDDSQVAIVELTVGGVADDAVLQESVMDDVTELAETSTTDTMAVHVGGTVIADDGMHLGPTEIAGALVAFVVLVVTFTSLIAAGATMLTALMGVVVGTLGIFAYSAISPIDSSTPILAVMLGLAVGIDYTLFILSRFRDELKRGRSVDEALPMAIGTAGSAVVFAGLTVVIALAGLAVVQIPFITQMGFAAAMAIVVAVVMSLTLGSVLMKTLGTKLLPMKIGKRSEETEQSTKITFFERWAQVVTARPREFLIGAIAVLAFLSIPVLSIDTALSTPGGSDPASEERTSYNLIADHFGDGYQSPLIVLVQSDDANAASATVTEGIGAIDHVASVQPAGTNEANTAAILMVTATTGPNAVETAEVVDEIRLLSDQGSDIAVSVTGQTAVDTDVDAKLSAALIIYLLVVVGLAMALLIVLFRSLLVPLLASLGFLLTIGVSFGALIAVFQWGWMGNLFGIKEGTPILSLLPIIIVGILFGLAMDYQVFLVSRIHEAHVQGYSTREAILHGFGRSAAIVAAAAIIMAVVFMGFGLSGGLALVAALAFSMATGVLVDAFVVRMIIIPASLMLIGAKSWWIPAWLDKILPHIDTEGQTLEVDADDTDDSGPIIDITKRVTAPA